MSNHLKKLRWAFSNRVVAQSVAANVVAPFRQGDWVALGYSRETRKIRKVWIVDHRSLVLYVY